MTSTFRTVQYGAHDWRGILINVTLEKQRHVDHLQIETLNPVRAPPRTEASCGASLPLTTFAYRPTRRARTAQ